jgi:hypothetical protein
MEYDERFLKRFWDKVEKTDGCWLWTASKTRGYGVIGIGTRQDNKKMLAHRVSLEIHLGRPILDGMDVSHAPIICHNRACVNPQHLREATRIENSMDRHLDGTILTGKDNYMCRRRFTEEQVKLIRLDDRVNRIIGEEYGVSGQTIGDIKHKRMYAWVPD